MSYINRYGHPSMIPTKNNGFCDLDSTGDFALDDMLNDPQNFHVSLDVHNYAPEELSVKHVNDSVIVRGECALKFFN